MSRLAFPILLLASLIAQAEKPNILLIAVDDLRPELGSYGADYIQSPNIDHLAEEGRQFTRHYVQAPTCGASRYALLTGTYGPSHNDALFKRAKKLEADPGSMPPSLPHWFKEHGYTTVSIGKVSHHPGGLGGKDWNNPEQPEMPFSWDRALMPVGPWEHPRGAMHGLADGEIRVKSGQMDVFQSFDGPDAAYPDGLIKEAALEELDTLANAKKPFFLAVGFIKPHLPFGSPSEYMAAYEDAELPAIPHPEMPEGVTTWHKSGEFMKYNRWDRDPNDDPAFAEAVRKHYAACVSYTDKQIGELLARLKKDGLADNTIIVLWGDHGWHLGEHAVWGKHTLFEESLRAPLIIVAPGMAQPGEPSDAIVETIDLYPTLCELAGLPIPEDLDGSSLKDFLDSPDSSQAGGSAVSYQGKRATLRDESYRLIVHDSGDLELYDHRTDPGETKNIAAANPTVVEQLKNQLQAKLPANHDEL